MSDDLQTDIHRSFCCDGEVLVCACLSLTLTWPEIVSPLKIGRYELYVSTLLDVTDHQFQSSGS